MRMTGSDIGAVHRFCVSVRRKLGLVKFLAKWKECGSVWRVSPLTKRSRTISIRTVSIRERVLLRRSFKPILCPLPTESTERNMKRIMGSPSVSDGRAVPLIAIAFALQQRLLPGSPSPFWLFLTGILPLPAYPSDSTSHDLRTPPAFLDSTFPSC